MRRLPFGVLLAVAITGIALVAVLGMATVGSDLLERQANQDALARIDAANEQAATALARLAIDVARAARELAELPRATPAAEPSALAAFRAERGVHAVALLDGQHVAADDPPASGLEGLHPQEAAPSAPPTRASTGLPASLPPLEAGAPATALGHDAAGTLWLFADAKRTGASTTARAAAALTADVLGDFVHQPGLDLRLIERGAEPPEGETRARLRETAFRTGASADARLAAEDRFVAVRPLDGPFAGLALEAALPSAPVREALTAFRRRLLVLALGIASAAAACGLLLGGRLGRPVARLTAAAGRIGGGDLATPVDHESGAELGALSEALDDMRGHLRRQTADLRRQQAETAAVLGGIAEGVFSVDRDRRVRYLNPQAAALLGVEPEQTIGRFCGDVLRPATQGGVLPCDEQCPIVHARSRGSARAVEHLTRSDGTRRSVVLTSAPPTDELQFQVVRDETEGEAARRLRDAVLANVSHEFKTPLSAQLASIELLADRLAAHPDPAARELVLALERGSLRLTQLVDNLLESARIEAGSDSIRRRPVQLDEVVEQAVEWTAPLFAQRQQRLDVALPYPMPAITGDAPRLVQVLVNLLANANKFAPAGTAVAIGGAVGVDRVGLWIEDHGPGLPEIAGRSLFGRFVRATGDEEPEQSGMGLGLWIAQSIVERHGGSIDTERIGDRTRVAVRLPRAAAEPS